MKRTRLHSLLLIGIFLLGSFVIFGCGSDDSDSGGSASSGADQIEQLKSAGAAKVAIGNEPPYSKVEVDGGVTGFVPELTRAAMKGMGVDDIEPVVSTFDAMIPGLAAGQWEMVADGLLVTPDRCKEVLFSDPTTASIEALVVQPGNPKNLEGYASFAADSSVKVALIPATAYYEFALKNGLDKSQVVSVPDSLAGVDAVRAGRADVTPLLRQAVEAREDALRDVELLPDPPPESRPQVTANAFPKGSKALRDEFNKQLAKLKQDGTFAKLSEEWGFDAKLAEKVSVQEVDPACANQ